MWNHSFYKVYEDNSDRIKLKMIYIYIYDYRYDIIF